jgi:hypothetical protein
LATLRRAIAARAAQPGAWFYLLVAIMATAPAWIVRYPPLEDLPFHVATLRAVHNYADPRYDFSRDFFLNLGGTQYALYYVAGSVLAYVLGVANAAVAMTCLYLGGTVLALRALLRSLGKDERLCLFVVPLLVNVMFLYGLMPFMSGIPLMFLALSLAVPYIERPTWPRGIALAVTTLILFYTHVVPYALFGIGFAAIFPWTRSRKWLPVAGAVTPSLGAVLWWVGLSSQGKESAGALGGAFSHPPYAESMSRFPRWSMDVFRDSTDEWHFLALVLVALLALGLAQGDRDSAKPAARALVLIPITCTVLYFACGSQLGDVWLFAERFPVPGLMSLIPLMRMPRGARGWLVTALALGVAVSATSNVCRHFIEFQLEEVGDFDEAIDAMEPRKHVAALIYDKGSSIVNDVPFLHFGSYYQAQKGGVIQFSNSGALYWPVRFKEGHYPPPGTRPRLRWEWTPEAVSIAELFPYYDYVLTRGNGFNPPAGTFHLIWHGKHWALFARG